jgi:hypothetical protein
VKELPPYISRELILERLQMIFPVGTQNRAYLTREISASTIFTMLYIGAIEGNAIYLGPVHVYRMTREQAILVEEDARNTYRQNASKRKVNIPGERWYADNSREPIRDETLREGLVQIGAVESLGGVATTSNKPRYFLKQDFAKLFDPNLPDVAAAISDWQQNNLSKGALTRLALAKIQSNTEKGQILITFPNGETRSVSPGVSSEITKAVVEVFAKHFMSQPVVLWLSTSDNKVVARDDKLAASIGIKIVADKNLPDIILVDLGPKDPLIVFVEVVATDGAITERRQQALFELTDAAEFERSHVAFLTAYVDRESAGFVKTMRTLAWNSFVWFVSEPENIMMLRDGQIHLSNLTQLKR